MKKPPENAPAGVAAAAQTGTPIPDPHEPVIDESKEAAQLLSDIAADPDLKPPPTAAEKAEAEIDYEGEAIQLIEFAVLSLTPIYPFLDDIYTPTQIKNLGKAGGAVMRKYKLTAGAFFARWGAELTLLMVALPLAAQTIRGFREHKAAQEKEAPKQPAGTQQEIVATPAASDLSHKV